MALIKTITVYDGRLKWLLKDTKLQKVKISYIFLLVFIVSLLILSSCSEENLEPGVPAEVVIGNFDFSADFASEGSASQKIKDVWVFVDGATIGVFELPVSVPILKNGIGELRLDPGIELNGIATTRVNNPFFEPFIIEDFTFHPDSSILVIPQTSYRESTVFAWMEDFENPSISLDTANLGGNTPITRYSGQQVFEGSFSGVINLDSTHNTFEAATFNSHALPNNGSPVLLEMHYKNDHYFSVGIIEEGYTQIIKTDIMVLYPSEVWNKIYINFTDQVNASSANTFKVLVRTYLEDTSETATIQLDNMKLLHRQQ